MLFRVRARLVLFVLLVGLLVQGCGSTPSAQQSSPTTAPATREATAQTEAPLEAQTEAPVIPETDTAAAQTAVETATAAQATSAETAETESTTASETETVAAPGAQTTMPPGETVSLKVVTLPFISFAPFYIAQDEGYFAEQGLTVELVNMTQQQEIVPALASGQVDVSSGLLSAGILNTIARGGQIQIVADKGYIDPEGCPNFGLIARKALIEAGNVETADALRGKTFSLVRATWLDYLAEKLLNPLGLTVEDMNLVDIPSPAQPEAFEQGAIDLVMQNEPWVTRFMEAGHQPILTPVQELLPDSQSAVTLYGPSLIGENADVGDRFMVAYLKAVRQYNEGKTDRNIEIMATNIQLEPELLRKMCWPTLRADGSINVESVLDFQEWALGKKLMDTAVTEDQFWNPRFVEFANAQLGEAQE